MLKQLLRPANILTISLFLVMFGIGFNQSSLAQSSKIGSNSGAALFFQTTNTPQLQEGKSEIGSTDGITIMSFAIVAIIIIPILLQRRNWSQA